MDEALEHQADRGKLAVLAFGLPRWHAGRGHEVRRLLAAVPETD
jgi:hypothetical protein